MGLCKRASTGWPSLCPSFPESCMSTIWAQDLCDQASASTADRKKARSSSGSSFYMEESSFPQYGLFTYCCWGMTESFHWGSRGSSKGTHLFTKVRTVQGRGQCCAGNISHWPHQRNSQKASDSAVRNCREVGGGLVTWHSLPSSVSLPLRLLWGEENLIQQKSIKETPVKGFKNKASLQRRRAGMISSPYLAMFSELILN